jgi:hypothetical protein
MRGCYCLNGWVPNEELNKCVAETTKKEELEVCGDKKITDKEQCELDIWDLFDDHCENCVIKIDWTCLRSNEDFEICHCRSNLNKIKRTQTYIIIGFWNYEYNSNILDTSNCTEIFADDAY